MYLRNKLKKFKWNTIVYTLDVQKQHSNSVGMSESIAFVPFFWRAACSMAIWRRNSATSCDTFHNCVYPETYRMFRVFKKKFNAKAAYAAFSRGRKKRRSSRLRLWESTQTHTHHIANSSHTHTQPTILGRRGIVECVKGVSLRRKTENY